MPRSSSAESRIRLLTGAHPSLKAGHASRASSRFSWLHILASGNVFFAKPPASCSKSKPTAIANPSFWLRIFRGNFEFTGPITTASCKDSYLFSPWGQRNNPRHTFILMSPNNRFHFWGLIIFLVGKCETVTVKVHLCRGTMSNHVLGCSGHVFIKAALALIQSATSTFLP